MGKIEKLVEKLISRIKQRSGLPSELPWIMFQSFQSSLFIHWPISVETIRPLVPAWMEIETYDGQAWLTLIPFYMTNLRWRDLPPVPGLSAFPEINLQTYVRVRDQVGLTLLSIEANNFLAIWFAKHLFHMPYFQAEMEFSRRGDTCYIESHRLSSAAGPAADFLGSYRPVGKSFQPKEDSLEHFLLEQTILFNPGPGGVLYRGEAHHLPWTVQKAEAEIETNTILQAAGIELPPTPPLLHFCAKLDTVLWPMIPFCF